MKVNGKLSFHYLVSSFTFKNRSQIKNLFRIIIKKEKHDVSEIKFVFCSDAYLLKINAKFLKHRTLTDVVTFPLSEPDKPLCADVYISIERVRENAQKFHGSFQSELHRVLIHGILHLCGYKDKTQTQKNEMRKLEDYYMNFVSREIL